MTHLLDLQKKHFEMFGEPKTVSDVGDFAVKVLNNHLGSKNEVYGLAFDMSYYDFVSNTHSCPILGVTNFSCKDDTPKHYPGFSGRLWLMLKSDLKDGLWVHDLPKIARIHPGTGGYGCYKSPWSDYSGLFYSVVSKQTDLKKSKFQPYMYSWDAKMFVDDFPILADYVKSERLAQMLINEKTPLPSIKESFRYTSNAATEMMEEFKEKYGNNP